MNIDDEDIETSSDALFHYTKASTAIEHILHTKKFKPSLLKDTNDLRECEFKVFGTTGSVPEPDAIRLLDKAQYFIDKILRNESRVMCFCTNEKPKLILSDDSLPINDEYAWSEGWSKSRMWSQYGQNHHGICLVFSKEGLKSVLANAKKKSQIKDSLMFPVDYSQQDRYDFKAINLDSDRLEKEGVEEYSFNHVMENSKELLFRKHIDYRDEAEFRVVVFDPDKKFEYLDISSLIKCVIVGDRTSKAYIPLIKQMCADLKIKFRKASWSANMPKMYLSPI